MKYKNRWTDRYIDNMDMAFAEIVQTGSCLHADIRDRKTDMMIPIFPLAQFICVCVCGGGGGGAK